MRSRLHRGGRLAAWPAVAQDLNGFFPARGQGDIALSYTTESYDQFWVGTTKVSVPAIGETTTRSFALWLRYGLTDRLAVIANVPYVEVTSDGLGGLRGQRPPGPLGPAGVQGAGGRLGEPPPAGRGVGGRTELSDYEANSR